MPLFVICMQGLSGSGKTTVAQQLAASYRAVLFRSDLERKKLFGLSEMDDSSKSGKSIYTPEANEKTFLRLQELTTQALQQNKSVVLDAAFLKKAERDAVRQLADSQMAIFLIVKCLANDATLCERIRKRRSLGNDASEATEALIEQQKIWEEPLTQEELPYSISLSTDSEDWRMELKHKIQLEILP